MIGHMKKIYSINEDGLALLKTLVDPLSEFFIDAVIDLETAIENDDMPIYGETVFGSEHFDEVKGEWQ